MKHKWLRHFDSNGKWTRESREVKLDDGSIHSIDDLAKKHGIELPDAKKQINTDTKEHKHADLGQPLDEGDSAVDGDGDSESSE